MNEVEHEADHVQTVLGENFDTVSINSAYFNKNFAVLTTNPKNIGRP